MSAEKSKDEPIVTATAGSTGASSASAANGSGITITESTAPARARGESADTPLLNGSANGAASSSATTSAPGFRTSTVSVHDVSVINSLCTAAWTGDIKPLSLEANLNFLHFTGFVNETANSPLRSALFVIHAPEESTTAAAAPAAATTDAATTTTTATTTNRRRKGFTFKVIPIRDVIGLEDDSKIEAVAVRPLFYAAASGKRTTLETLISAYKKGDYDTSSNAPVWEVKPHPDKPGKYNLMGESQYDACIIAKANGFEECSLLLEHPNSRSCTDSRGCGQDCVVM